MSTENLQNDPLSQKDDSEKASNPQNQVHEENPEQLQKKKSYQIQ